MWLVGSLSIMITTGTLLFTSEAVKCYYSKAFWRKMSSLVLAILFTLTSPSRCAARQPTGEAPF